MTKRVIDTVIFDMDGTAAFTDTHEASWTHFFDYMGVGSDARRIASAYDNKETNVMSPGNHRAMFRATVSLLKGKAAPDPKDVFPSLPYAQGFSAFCSYLRSHGVQMAIVTLSIQYAANRIAEENGIPVVRANEFLIQNGAFTGDGRIHVLFGSKGDVVRDVYESFGSRKESTAYIGDSLNDAGPWSEVGLPLGVNLHHPGCRDYVVADFGDFYQMKRFFEENVAFEKTQ